MQCSVCWEDCQVAACSRCGSVLYCGRRCQRQDWPRHKAACSPSVVKITSLQGRGAALIATQPIRPGTRILEEKPLLLARIPASVTEARIILQEEYDEAWADCSPQLFRENVSRSVVSKALQWLGAVDKTKSQQKLYRSLYDKDEPKTDFGIFLTNALPLSDYNLMGVFPVINRMNHACSPNCSAHWNKQTGRLEIFSMEDIEAGTELTITYLDMLSNQADREARQEYLNKHFYFLCKCRLCNLTGSQLDQDDTRRRQVKLLYQKLRDSCHDDLVVRLKLVSEILQHFTQTPYPPSITWRFHLAGFDIHSRLGDNSAASACLHTAETLFLSCRDQQHEDYKLLERRK